MTRIGKIYRVHPSGLAKAKASQSEGWMNFQPGSLVKVVVADSSHIELAPLIEKEFNGRNAYLWIAHQDDPTSNKFGINGNLQYLEEL
jgi:hypothetical protein